MKMKRSSLCLVSGLCSLVLAACTGDPALPPQNGADVPRDVSADGSDAAPPPDADGPDASQDDVAPPDDLPPADVSDAASDARDAGPLDAPRDVTSPDAAPQDAPREVGSDAAADARADAAADVPVGLGPTIPCAECRRTRCQSSNDACQTSVFCAERFTCLDRCPRQSSPAECRSGCTRAWPATSQSNAFVACLRAMCPGSCPDYQ